MEKLLDSPVTARLTTEDTHQLEHICAKRKMSRSEFVRKLVIGEIKKEETKAEQEQ